MSLTALDRQIQREEQDLARNLSSTLTEALRNRRVQSDADAATTESGRRPQRQVVRVFERALASAERRAGRDHRGVEIDSSISYTLNGSSWQATVEASAEFERQRRGGATYVLVAGDTLWRIAEEQYGSGVYWERIAQENRRVIDSRSRFLECGAEIRVPTIEVPRDPESVQALRRPGNPPREARRPARQRERYFPTVSCDLHEATSAHSADACVGGVSVRLTIEAKGSLQATRTGQAPLNFNCRQYQTEMSRQMGNVTASFSITEFTTSRLTLTNSVLNGRYQTGVSLDSDGTFTFSISPRSFRRTVRGVEIEGSIGFDISVRITGACGDGAGAESTEGVRSTSSRRGANPSLVNTAGIAAVLAVMGRSLINFGTRLRGVALLPITLGTYPDTVPNADGTLSPEA